jgi:hypothetical protein
MNYFETPNTVVENVFTQNEINQVYQAVGNNSGGEFIQPHAQANTFIKLPDAIVEKIEKYARDISGNDNLVLTEYCHSRYQNVTSNCGKFHFKPSLFPHYDETFKEPRFTFDIQLNANIEWPLVVAPDTKFVLKNNQALTFSGTNQIHWREPVYFEDDQYVEMLFCHLTDPSEPQKSDMDNELVKAQSIKYKRQFFANGGFTNESE